MKKVLTFGILILMGNLLMAQTMTIAERTVSAKGTQVNAWVISVGDNQEMAKKTFTDFSKKELKLKPKSQGKMIVVSEEANLSAISTKRGDFKGIIFSEGNTYKMGVSFALGYDIVINSQEYPAEMAALRDVTIDYMKFHYTRYYDEALEKKERERSKFEKQVKQTEKEISTLRASNKRSEKRIYKTEDQAVELELQNKIAQNKLTIENLNQKLPGLNHQIEQKNEEITETKNEYNDVMAQIRALRTAMVSEAPEAYDELEDIY